LVLRVIGGGGTGYRPTAGHAESAEPYPAARRRHKFRRGGSQCGWRVGRERHMSVETVVRDDLESLLRAYARQWPDEGSTASLFAGLTASGLPGVDPFRRERLDGHFTGSAWVVSADGSRTLLMHHRKLERWLQPGGHADGERDLAQVALREAAEETGLAGLEVDPAIFDLDRHAIPARGSEPEHWHYDVRFVVRARGAEAFVVNEEALGLAWKPVREVAERPAYDPSLRRMARKWLARGGA
jgi:8-oxo-dGTP pyrophosphatase MutT (NUDIX family)